MSYSTNVLIINRTRWTITGDYKHKWGTTRGAVPGTIPPGKTSAMLTANPPNVFRGAEGRYTLHLEGAGLGTADKNDTTIVFREGCPRGAHNYWYLDQGSPLARVDARIGHGQPIEAADWGSPSKGGGNVGGGDVLGIQITITEQLPVNVQIVNKTPWAITGTRTDEDIAGGVLPVEVAPYSVSEMVTEVFSATAPFYDLHLVGLDTENMDDTRVTFMSPADASLLPYGWQLGPAVSPFVRVDARFRLGQPNGADDWGSTHFPRFDERIGMDPLGMQVTITQQTPATRLSVLTYNTHLFKDSPADFGAQWLLKVVPQWLPMEFKREMGRHAGLLALAVAFGYRSKLEALATTIREQYEKLLKQLGDARVVYMDDERQAELVRRIQNPLHPADPGLDWPPDIVCLQEVWGEDRQKALREELVKIYPYVYIPPNSGFKVRDSFRDWMKSLILDEILKQLDSVPTVVRRALGLGTAAKNIATEIADDFVRDIRDVPDDINLLRPGDMDKLTNSSGLMVASRFPIFEPTFQMYEGASKQDDQLAKKGALTLRVRAPLTAVEVFDVGIGTTHAYTPTDEANANVKLLAGQTISISDASGKKPDAILLGDFNLGERSYVIEGCKAYAPDGEVGQEYLDLVAELSSLGFHEVVEDESQGVKPGNYATHYTDWNGGINLSHLMEGKPLERDLNKRDRIDYVFLRPGDESHLQSLGPSGVRVFHDWKIRNEEGDDVEVSDHMPILVEFTVVPSVPESSLSQAAPEPTSQPVG